MTKSDVSYLQTSTIRLTSPIMCDKKEQRSMILVLIAKTRVGRGKVMLINGLERRECTKTWKISLSIPYGTCRMVTLASSISSLLEMTVPPNRRLRLSASDPPPWWHQLCIVGKESVLTTRTTRTKTLESIPHRRWPYIPSTKLVPSLASVWWHSHTWLLCFVLNVE